VSFLNPGGLWWLIGVPILVLLYMLRSRRTDVRVSSLVLWRMALRDHLARTPVRRIEKNLLLLVQILVMAIMALALARPQIPFPNPGGDDLVLVIDISATMQATDVPPTRFEAARGEALRIAGSLGRGQDVAVIGAGPSPRLLAALAPRKDRALEILRSLRPSDGAGDLLAAMRLARAQARPGRALRVHVFSDQPVDGAASHVFRGGGRNIALYGLFVVPLPDGRQRAVLHVLNATPDARRANVRIAVDGKTAADATVSLAPGEDRGLRFDVPAGAAVEAGLDAAGDLPVFQRLAATGAAARQPAVLLVGAANPFLEQAVRAIPGTRFARTPRVEPQTWASVDVVILDRQPKMDLPPGNYLLIRTVPSNPPVTAGPELRGPRILRWKQTHAILRFVDLAGLEITESLSFPAPLGDPLLEAQSPIAWAHEDRGRRIVALGFDVTKTNLPFLPAFPLLMSNTVAWLAGPQTRLIEAGTPVTVPAGAQREAMLAGPDGSMRLTASDGLFVTPPLDRGGLYTLQTAAGPILFAVQPPAREAALASGPAPTGEAAESRPGRGLREMGHALVLLVLALLAAEWWIFMRRQGRWSPAPASRRSAA
jgi:hypothetical protein